MSDQAELTDKVDSILREMESLNKFVSEAEKLLYQTEDLIDMDTETLLRTYAEASKRQMQLLELARKIAMAPKKPSEEKDREIMELAKMLKDMRKIDLEKIQQMVHGTVH